MQDFTQGSIPRHILKMAIPVFAGMIFQTLYYLVDLYFVAQLGGDAVAGVSATGNLQFIVLALTQVLSVGTMVLISHASGRKDPVDANRIFHQSLLMAGACIVITLAGGFLFGDIYTRALSANEATALAAKQYLATFLPALALQFALVTMGSALRGTGVAKPTMIVQVLSVIVNAILAPILIAGWGTGHPLGVRGAGLASTIAVLAAVVMMLVYFLRLDHFVQFDRKQLALHWDTWKRILKVGLPAGGEFALMFVYMGLIYVIIRDVGASAQAGFGIGGRVMQSLFIPSMAIAFAAAPIAGQNIGAGNYERAKKTFLVGIGMETVMMIALTIVAQLEGNTLVQIFTKDPAVVAVGAGFLSVISINFVSQGIIFTASGMFQALGNTVPAMISSGTRVITFAVPAWWMHNQPGFELRKLWYLSVATVTLQMFVSVGLLARTWRQTVKAAKGAPPLPAAG
ncbi:MAG: MATE family efflux transporter [Gemmatimonadetes bacterium]|nr:MATE family efflux transporter [Gemmatimonadota bacterium]